MRLIGDFKINTKVVGVTTDTEVLSPYLFLHPSLQGSLTAATMVNLAPANNQATHILNALVECPKHDGLLLWCCRASHKRYRVQRHLCSNAVIINTGEWGSNVIAVCRDDMPSVLVFSKGLDFETATLEQGVVLRSMEQREAI